MNNKDIELDIIKTEQNFFNVGDPIPVNPVHDHELHIDKHQETLDMLLKEEESAFRNQKILVLSEHIECHKVYNERKSNK